MSIALTHLRSTLLDENWRYLEEPEILLEHGKPVIFVGCIDDSDLAQGIFACARKVTIWCCLEGNSVSYQIHGELLYVAPKARRRGLGSALTAAMAMCVHDDLEQLCRIWRRSKTPIEIRAWISGEAHSLGGERAFESLQSVADLVADMSEGVLLKVEPDWSV